MGRWLVPWRTPYTGQRSPRPYLLAGAPKANMQVTPGSSPQLTGCCWTVFHASGPQPRDGLADQARAGRTCRLRDCGDPSCRERGLCWLESAVLLPQSSHSGSFNIPPHPTSPLSCSFLQSPLLWLSGGPAVSHLSGWIPRDRTETSALSFHFWGRSCWLHHLWALRDPTASPWPPTGGWLEEGLLVPRLPSPTPPPSSTICFPSPALECRTNRSWGGSGRGFSDCPPASHPSGISFQWNPHHTPPPRKAGGDTGSLHRGPAAGSPAPLGQDHALHT